MATMMYSACVRRAGGLIGPTKSMPHLAKALAAMIGLSGMLSLAIGGFVLWQTSQRFTNSNASLKRVGHHRPDHSIFLAVVSPEKCPPTTPECAWCRTFLNTYPHSHKDEGYYLGRVSLYSCSLINV